MEPANGNKTTGNNIQFNGVDANNLAENSAENAVEEVGVAARRRTQSRSSKLKTGKYDASYGRGTGANVDVIGQIRDTIISWIGLGISS